MAKKKADCKAAWDKVYVICGEPCLARLSLDTLVEGKRVKRFYNNENIDYLKLALSGFSIKSASVVLYEPVAESLNLCLGLIESNKLTTDQLIIFVSGDNIDGRLSLYSKALKNKRIFNYSYIEASDLNGLKKHLTKWEKETGILIEPKAMQWLIDNAPIILEKIKSPGGKRDTEVYNLQAVETELEKISTLCEYEHRSICLNDVVEFCTFNRTVDIWIFIKAAIGSNYKESFKLISKMIDVQGINTVLWLLHSQLTFLIQLKHYLNQGITDITVLQDKMSYKQYLSRYYNDDWQEVDSPTEPIINPWRIRKAMESIGAWSMDKLVSQEQAVTSALEDMRSSGSEDIILPYLVLSMSGMARYTKGLYVWS